MRADSSSSNRLEELLLDNHGDSYVQHLVEVGVTRLSDALHSYKQFNPRHRVKFCHC